MKDRCITEQMIRTFDYLFEVEEATAIDIAKAIGAENIKVLHKAMGRWVEHEKKFLVIKRYEAGGGSGRGKPVYALSANTRAILEQGGFSGDRKKSEKPAAKALKRFDVTEVLKDSAAMSLIKLNHDIVSHATIAREIGVSSRTVERVLSHIELPISDAFKHPSAHDISGAFGLIPAFSIKTEWLGGTVITSPSGTSGINSVTRHFAGE